MDGLYRGYTNSMRPRSKRTKPDDFSSATSVVPKCIKDQAQRVIGKFSNRQFKPEAIFATTLATASGGLSNLDRFGGKSKSSIDLKKIQETVSSFLKKTFVLDKANKNSVEKIANTVFKGMHDCAKKSFPYLKTFGSLIAVFALPALLCVTFVLVKLDFFPKTGEHLHQYMMELFKNSKNLLVKQYKALKRFVSKSNLQKINSNLERAAEKWKKRS